MNKYCLACQKEHLIEEFSKNGHSKDGYRNSCKMSDKQKKAIQHKEYHKIDQLFNDLEAVKKLLEKETEAHNITKEQLEAWLIKCEIAEKRRTEMELKYDLLVQDLKSAGKWPVKG